MDYQIEFTKKATKQFRRLPIQEKKRLQKVINQLVAAILNLGMGKGCRE